MVCSLDDSSLERLGVLCSILPHFPFLLHWLAYHGFGLASLTCMFPREQVIDIYLTPKGGERHGVSYRGVASGTFQWLQACP